MKSVFKNADVREEFQKLIRDEAFTVKRFGFKRAYLENVLLKNLPMQNKTASKFLEAYNGYYETSLRIQDIFDRHEIVKRTADDIEFRFGDDPSKQVAFRFIEKILSMRGPSGVEMSPA